MFYLEPLQTLMYQGFGAIGSSSRLFFTLYTYFIRLWNFIILKKSIRKNFVFILNHL